MYDVEAGHLIVDEPQDGLVAPPIRDCSLFPWPSRLRMDQHHNDGNTQRMSEEPIAPLLPKPLNEDGGEEREVDFSELDRDLLPALEEQEKPLSATSPNSLYLPHCYTEPSRAQIGQGYEQGATSQGRLEGLRDDSELCNQDHGEEKRSEQEQPEGGGGSRRGNEGRGGQKR
jgi:hypothetical protein